jgi:hypothetical protein
MGFSNSGPHLEYEATGRARLRLQCICQQIAGYSLRPLWVGELCSMGQMWSAHSLRIGWPGNSGSWEKTWLRNYEVWKWRATWFGKLEDAFDLTWSHCRCGTSLLPSTPILLDKRFYRLGLGQLRFLGAVSSMLQTIVTQKSLSLKQLSGLMLLGFRPW